MNMKRRLDSEKIENLKKTILWQGKILKDCKNQNVFLAIRDNRIDMYHKGGKLFSFYGNCFKTHIKYASVITNNTREQDYLTEKELDNYKLVSDFKSNYERIKENCSNYSGIEASGVSCLYHKHSYLSEDNVVVLDIEISIESQNEQRKQDRIDILLYNKLTRILQFVEAKHYSNKEIWSNETPAVIDQIKRYESQIENSRSDILSQYAEYINLINDVFNLSLPEPKEIDGKVKLLIFGFDKDQRENRLKTLITGNKEYSGVKMYCIGNINKIEMDSLWKGNHNV